MSSQTSQPVVLEYKKRRFDGGTEREIIERIERQHQANQLHAEQLRQATRQIDSIEQPASSVPMAPQPAQAPVVAKVKRSWAGIFHKAVIVPHIELILGLSGLVIAQIMSFSWLKDIYRTPETMKQDREILQNQSWKVVRGSLWSILSSPWQVVRLSIQAA